MRKLRCYALLVFIYSASFSQQKPASTPAPAVQVKEEKKQSKADKKEDKVKKTTTIPQKVHNIFSKHKK